MLDLTRRVLISLPSPTRRLLAPAGRIPWLRRFAAWADETTAEVVLVSFPKTGRTWLRLLIGRALTKQFGLSNANPMELHQLAARHPGIPKIWVSHDDNPQFKAPDDLETSKRRYRRKKVILLVRDPRDVLVSLYFQMRQRRQRYTGDLSTFITERVGSFDTLLRFYNIWAAERHVPRDLLLVRYEDLSIDPARELRRVLRFIGLPEVPDVVIAEAVQFAAFGNMRRMEVADRFGSRRLRPADPDDPESYKTRRGRVGGHVEYLQPAEITDLTAKMQRTLDPFYGYGR